MKKIFLLGVLGILLVSACSNGTADKEKPAIASMGAEVLLKGVLIDNLCAETNKANLPEFVKKHTKECALMPNCAASGYSLYSEGKLQQFDKESNAKIEKFLMDKKSTLKVDVRAKAAGDKLILIDIVNGN